MWGLPRPGIALQRGFLTTGPPGKPGICSTGDLIGPERLSDLSFDLSDLTRIQINSSEGP